jgi:hypothetical protein
MREEPYNQGQKVRNKKAKKRRKFKQIGMKRRKKVALV